MVLAIFSEIVFSAIFLAKSMAREARSTLNFFEVRLTAYVETISLTFTVSFLQLAFWKNLTTPLSSNQARKGNKRDRQAF
ncbi:hypothetical protein TH606_05545 [Thermodesulfatator autotrophicus]|uniref:Uncharacterized protein n=1 Tax=Thermodesulfatator autotrophicus TaxID=1795632 RepID=A0A177E840_9BACT|nr:hypothetical protein TH606_05545 [Thermodesulfatator autotrophicus]